MNIHNQEIITYVKLLLLQKLLADKYKRYDKTFQT